MRGFLDHQQLSSGNAVLNSSVLTVLGDRQDQQDSFGFEWKAEEGLIVVCDGMGGLNEGGRAGQITADTFLNGYQSAAFLKEPAAFLMDCVFKADSAVRNMKDENGKKVHAGSTVVSVLIQGHNMYWLSVGDSRGYLFRRGELVQFTQDHNYFTVLQEKKNAGLIDWEEYLQQSEKAEALISYVGMEKLKLIDYSKAPLQLLSGDRVLLMSDGLYKLVSDEEISRIIGNFHNIHEALQALELKAQKKARRMRVRRDNMTAALVEIK